jgi:hypothetical protein
MKALSLLLIPLLLTAAGAGAQAQTADSPSANTSSSKPANSSLPGSSALPASSPAAPAPENYSILSAGFGRFFLSTPGRDISATLPYMVKDVNSGLETNQTFNGSARSLFKTPVNMINLLNFELVRKHESIDLGFGLAQERNADKQGFYLKGGYRYILPLGPLLIKPGVDNYFVIAGQNTIGSIDNRQKEIFLAGYHAGDQFTVTTSDDDGSTTDTYDADHLDISYGRTILLTEPKITLATRPAGRWAFSLEFGWMIQLVQWSNLEFKQFDASGDHSHSVGTALFGSDGTLSGPYAAINVGIYLWPKNTKKPFPLFS